MATYEEIKQKYGEAVKDRRSKIVIAKNRVALIEARIESFKKIREQYRQPAGKFNSEYAKEWNKLTNKISSFGDELLKAKFELSEIETVKTN